MRFRAVLMVFTLLVLAGCGQKGPLYLPQPDQGEAAAFTAVVSDSQTRMDRS